MPFISQKHQKQKVKLSSENFLGLMSKQLLVEYFKREMFPRLWQILQRLVFDTRSLVQNPILLPPQGRLVRLSDLQ